jgi:diaminohydroxyphosphoribosylaminopyrimidine deaminase/5-amino-6-(5-phosphoribosylamino)uracil reductase
MSSDVLHMSQALALAERGRGRTSPNPMVGAVIVDDEGVVVGRGSHQFAGGPHAEILALADAGARARGATLYCTLEPCSHTGRTGPCAPRVVDAGIRRAVIAVQDPNPLVAGRGLRHLGEHGVDVTVGVLASEAARLNAAFFSVMRDRRPFVTMKVALSRDGFVAARPGCRTQLTGAAANRWIHRERAEVDALGVGSRTILADDPVLTPRGAYRPRPLVRVVFDRGFRTPPGARILSTLDSGPIIIVGADPPLAGGGRRAEALAAAGARIESVQSSLSGRFLQTALTSLARSGVTSLVLEGGPTLHAAAWAEGVVDRIQVFRTPRSLGEGGVPWLDRAGLSLDDLEGVRTVRLGEDVMIEGYVHRAD